MNKVTVLEFTWISHLLRHKASVIGGIFAIISLSLSHYAGFLSNVPLQIVSVAGSPLAKSVTTTFLFHMFFCAVFARVITSVLQVVILPYFILNDRIEAGMRSKMSLANLKRFIRAHKRTIKWEGVVWTGLQFIIFLLLVLGIYIKFSLNWISGVGIFVALILITVTGLVRAEFFLQPKIRVFFRKCRRRPSRAGKLTSAVFATATVTLVIVAFLLGVMRASLLRDQKEYAVITREFNGIASVIASSGDEILFFQKKDGEFRYVYSAPNFTVSFESKPVFLGVVQNK